ncbi:MAG TPA: hypothetical protein VFY79_05865 [Dehalococcoidia bacterium]|nr:hypothetical protein [Dehalococcoidia bacterium]
MQLARPQIARPERADDIPAPSVVGRNGAEPAGLRYALMIAGAIFIGVAVRAMFVAASGFPLNDGGMFYAMVRDIQGAGYTIPQFTSYNDAHIPFTYPPLGFYLAAVVNDATPLSLVQVFRVLPLALSSLTIVAFFLLASDLLRSRVVVATAVLFFALIPPAFTWMIMGGGLTRALGFVFAILTVREVRRMYVTGSRWRVMTASVLAALTILSHLEMAWFAVIVSGLFFVAYGRTRTGIVQSAVVGALALVLTAPWWMLMVERHGLTPLVAAAHSTESSWWHPIALLVQFNVSGEPLFTVIAALAALGIIVLVARREYLLPCWVLVMAFLDQRAFLTSSTVAVAMLAAVAAHEVVLPLVLRPRIASDDRAANGVVRLSRSPAWLAMVVIMLMVAYPVLGAITSTPGLLQGLSPEEHTAMTWVSENTPASARFAVVTGRAWPVDHNSEWFPVLTGRESVATVQGYEWMAGGAFDLQRTAFAHLQNCSNADGDCLSAWSAESGESYDYVYVATVPPADDSQQGITCCDGLRNTLRRDSRYRVVFDGPGATVFRVIGH